MKITGKYALFDMINATQPHITTIAHSAAQAKVVSTLLLYNSKLVTSMGKYSARCSPIIIKFDPSERK